MRRREERYFGSWWVLALVACQGTLDLDVYSFEPDVAVGAAGVGGASGSNDPDSPDSPDDSGGSSGTGAASGSSASGAGSSGELEVDPTEPTEPPEVALDGGLGGCFGDAGLGDGRCVDAGAPCVGCSIEGRCIAAGAADPGDPCRTCQPSLALAEYTIELGRVCGADVANDCLEASRCDGAGACQAVYTGAGVGCGSPSETTCDLADTCDGAGACDARLAPDTTPCDDGVFCSAADSCVSGQCAAGGPRDCGPAQICNGSTNQCECTGCSIDGSCVARDTLNPNNGCQLCIPELSTTVYSANTGAACGNGQSTSCTLPDTCDATGACVANDIQFGTACFDFGSGCDVCDGAGGCVPLGPFCF